METIYWVTETPTGDADECGKSPVVPIFFRTLEDQQAYLRDEIAACSDREISVVRGVNDTIYEVELPYSVLSAAWVQACNIMPYTGEDN